MIDTTGREGNSTQQEGHYFVRKMTHKPVVDTAFLPAMLSQALTVARERWGTAIDARMCLYGWGSTADVSEAMSEPMSQTPTHPRE